MSRAGGDRGVTYLELIVAMAVLSIVLMFTARMGLFSARFDRENRETTRLALKAQGIMEAAVADPEFEPGSTDGSGDTIEFKREPVEGLNLEKVTVKVSSGGLSYSLVSYRLPGGGGGGSGGGGGGGGPREPGSPIDPNDWEYDSKWWTVTEDYIVHDRGRGQGEDKQNIFYKYKFKTFDYTAFLNYDIKGGGGGGNNYEGGITFGPTRTSYDWFYMTRGTGQQKDMVLLYYDGVRIPCDETFNESKTYFLQAVAADSRLVLRFGYLKDGNRVVVVESDRGYFDTGQEYILGLKDTTSGSVTIRYTFPPR